ncbi:MAG TPA: HD-GYP domain-containing protein [Gaiellaceae bacterium]|nr:HD-GYP domain-containing protein [Gaiellaceae bacterium]
MDGKRRLRRGRDLERSLTLLRIFLLASALICAGAGVALGWILSHSLRAEALDAEQTALVRYVDGVVRPTLVRGNEVSVPWQQDAQLGASVLTQRDILVVKVWKANGTNGVLAWTNPISRTSNGRRTTNEDRQLIDHRFPLDDELGEAIRENQAIAALVGTGGKGEDAFERNELGFKHLFEVYAPIENTAGTRAIGAYEIYADPRALDRLIGSRRTMLWVAVGVVFVALWAALALLVRGASVTLRRQNAKLRARTLRLAESNRLLEESALEAVESLNATVDAKDQYTAGHSQRVQRIAVALGEELGLDRGQLDVLRFAGLFHDIGKIGVPDAILTKPARLTELEFEIVKRHPEDGARIVGRLHRLRDAVPAILHHHERWDGNGYPHRLRGDSIPLEAAIVGLADAVDAMTTDRPYSSARTLDDATDEVMRNRGTQFAPAVVDAYVALVEREPELFGTDPAAGELVPA